ncbi:DUF423 domain-containing protein [Paenibacillus baekrokdamisoli]|uniref:DUF423 domain-containing protein n=1 Tax=Paenibacillus baekrokdamisoli TaxID=1712516 RepID=A0A3G9ITF0_9BACL|nr:DUF423 domain-containing protein [Paenibacillus baekrokdamisoli]MBB3071114.1 uncharacterized membrane protein YgdD (TMEM256/DUF423 family) [Paenibacillus baekrokdamisoli]BBH21532.1 DUF423 domain-containing protein [Paenibacillus baekrokdamisoli]
MFKKYGAIGALHALLAVVLGAFAAHGLKERLSADMLAVFETGVRYHMYHGIGLFLIALAADRIGESKGIRWAGRLMHAGIFLFSGSLYVLSLIKFKWLGIITPFGGVAFIIAWGLAANAIWKSKRND